MDESMHVYRTRAVVADNGSLTIENLPFAPGQEVEVIVRRSVGSAREDVDALAFLHDLIGTVEGPSDWAAEHDHYLYGTPKRNKQPQDPENGSVPQ